MRIKIMTGKVVKNIRVLWLDHVDRKSRHAMWKCLCTKCNKVFVLRSTSLRNGNTKTCGCGRTTHGHASRPNPTRTYRSWRGMWARCTNKNLKEYKNYGGRGISVCKRWEDFEKFYQDMGKRPSKKHHSIDRINVNGNYTPKNCRWATWRMQALNRRERRNK